MHLARLAGLALAILGGTVLGAWMLAWLGAGPGIAAAFVLVGFATWRLGLSEPARSVTSACGLVVAAA